MTLRSWSGGQKIFVFCERIWMVKHGSSHLRYAMMNCAQTVINNEPTFAAYYAKKRAEGKEHRVALTHVAKKLLRVIYTLQTKELSYNPDLVR